MPISIETKPYGQIEIEDSQVYEFPDGILAFEQLTRYAVIAAKKGTGFFWLQSLDEKALAFLIMKPDELVADYHPEVLEAGLTALGISDINKAEIWCIVTIPPGEPENMTINLQGPLIINPETRQGGQFISENEKHSVRAKVFDLLDRGVI